MAAPVDPFPDFLPGDIADANKVDSRFLALYDWAGDLTDTPAFASSLTVGGKPAVRGEERLKELRGTVGSDGSIVDGQGFSVSRVGVGVYEITATGAPYTARPSGTANATYTISAVIAQVTQMASLQKMEVRTLTTASAPVDNAFNFVIAGPVA